MKQKFNKLDEPLKNFSVLSEQILWKEYEFMDKFQYVCEVEANRDEEKLVIIDQVVQDMKKSCVYVMVIGGRIFKIGTALRGVKKPHWFLQFRQNEIQNQRDEFSRKPLDPAQPDQHAGKSLFLCALSPNQAMRDIW